MSKGLKYLEKYIITIKKNFNLDIYKKEIEEKNSKYNFI
jgi:hypothetical protein